MTIAGAVLTGGGVIVAKIGAWVAKIATHVGPLITTVTTVKDALKTLTGDAVAGIKKMFTMDGFVDSVVDMFFGKDPLEGLPEVKTQTEGGDDKTVGGKDGISRLANAIGRIAKHAIGGYAKVTSFLRVQFAHVNFSQKPWFRNLAGVAAALVQGADAVENPSGAAEQGTRSLREAVDGFFAGVSARFETITGPIKAMASGVLDPTKLFESLLEKGLEWVLNLLITSGPSATLSAALRGVQKLLGAGKTIAGELMNLTIAGEPVGQMLVGMITPAIKGLPVFSEIQSLVGAAGGFLAELAGGLQSQLGDLRSAVSAALSSGATFLADFLGITLPKDQGAEPNKPVQRSAKSDDGGAMAVDGAAERSLASSSGRPLETGVRARMEDSFGRDFSSVRVHTDGHADAASSGLRAHALTQGSNIYFASGSYRPGTRQGDELLAHELTHVVQQNAAPPLGGATQSRKASSDGVRAKRATSTVGDAAEQQADRVGRGVAAGDVAAAREVSPHLIDDGTIHRKSSGSAATFKSKFRQRLFTFGQAVGHWDAAIKQAAHKAKRYNIESFASEFTNTDHTMTFISAMGTDPMGFLGTLLPSLRLGELPSEVRRAVSDAKAQVKTSPPTVEKDGARMHKDTWNAFQYLYGIATLALVASGMERTEAAKTDSSKIDLSRHGFTEACLMVKTSSGNTKTQLMVFYLPVSSEKATLNPDRGLVTVKRPMRKPPVDTELRAAVQKSADTRYELMKKHWLGAVAKYSERNDKVLGGLAVAWNPKDVGDNRLKIVRDTAQQAANKNIRADKLEDRLKPKSELGRFFLTPMAGDLSFDVKERQRTRAKGKYAEDRATTRWDADQGHELVGKFSIAEGEEKADLNLMNLVNTASLGTDSGTDGIVAFMLKMARDRRVTNGKTTLTFEQFNDASGKHPMSWHHSNNSDWVKNKFREAMDGTHEWIPSNMINEVIERAIASRRDGHNPAKWIYAQHLTRTLTSMIIFTPSKEFLEANDPLKKKIDVKLEGHSGALYLIKKNSDGERYASPQTGSGDEDQNAWHDGLRVLFKAAPTPEVLLEQIAGYADRHVWNGELGGVDAEHPIDFRDARMQRLKDAKGAKVMTIGQLGSRQRIYHREIQFTIQRTLAELQKYNTN